MVESKVYLQRVTEPKIGGKIYFQFIETTRTLEPCIVESGQYLDSQFGRLSNFWCWMNLRTGKREHGYGCFYEMVEIAEGEKQEEATTVSNPNTPTETDFKYFTAEQVRNMSQSEVKANYSDIRKSMELW